MSLVVTNSGTEESSHEPESVENIIYMLQDKKVKNFIWSMILGAKDSETNIFVMWLYFILSSHVNFRGYSFKNIVSLIHHVIRNSHLRQKAANAFLVWRKGNRGTIMSKSGPHGLILN